MWLFTFCNNVVHFQDWFLKRSRFIPHGRASKGERAIEAALRKHGIRFETQYELGYYVHVDFAVYMPSAEGEKLFLVEYDGRQHYHPVKYFGGRWKFILQRMRDTIEGWECKDRGIPLLRIRYDLPLDKIEGVLMEFLNQQND